MITVEKATELILENKLSLPEEEVPLDECLGRVLSEDLIADRDFPPFDRVTMDGVALDYGTWLEGKKTFTIQETVSAGSPQVELEDTGYCIEVMTGAMLPLGCDTVIRYEDLVVVDHKVEVISKNILPGQNIHARGSDHRKNDVLANAGDPPVSAAEIGVAATIGKSVLKVFAVPKIALISTGNELVDIHESPLSHQIRRSNVYQIKALLAKYRTPVMSFHLVDDPSIIEKTIRQALEEYDCVILTGGVSAGKYDYVPDVLENLGVEKIFHGVSQRPGKPFWFGKYSKDKTVFALPGNPISSFMCTVRYVIPWLKTSLGIYEEKVFAILAEPFTFRPALTYFLQVLLEYRDDSTVFATPVEGNGSGDLANLLSADAFLELPDGKAEFADGEVYRVWRFRE